MFWTHLIAMTMLHALNQSELESEEEKPGKEGMET